MTTRPPDFDDLVGGEVPREERARLHRVHELLVQADQPPELSPELDAVPWPNEALAPVAATASATVSKTGMPSTSWPPLPGVTPATTLVP